MDGVKERDHDDVTAATNLQLFQDSILSLPEIHFERIFDSQHSSPPGFHRLLQNHRIFSQQGKM